MPKGEDIPETESAQRFAAFISYSHADARVAAKLQRQLERYRLPKNVAQTHESKSTGIGRIFRDREDLAAAPSLSDAIREALNRAGALIVICSPDAQKSRWVAEEIALFRAIHPDRPILAALVRGEPDGSFPSALTDGGLEPLAADMRKNADGWSLGFLKIVAGIAAVPLDALVQRDAQRRLRRVTGITLGALTAMLVMGVMTVFAISARNEAARQRASAEGLVEYMLTDLRGKLKGVGRLDVMEGVTQRAMQHYRSQGDLSRLPADSLDRRARLLHAWGEDDDQSGNMEQAQEHFLLAHRATAALLEREPENPDRIFAHAQSEYWAGQAAWRRRDRATTAKYWRGYVYQAEKLLKIDKDRARANLEMGYALGNMCDFYLRDNYDLDKAIANCRQSIDYERVALRHAPERVEIGMALANRYGWLADALVANKAYVEARAARKSEQAIVDGLLAKDPRNFELRFRQLWPELGLTLLNIEQGRKAEGAAQLKKLEAKIVALSRESPDNFEVKRAWARVLYNRTKALIDVDPKAARVALVQTSRLVDQIDDTPEQKAAMSGFHEGIQTLEKQLTNARGGRDE
jgi:MTH538 TIR-like domain (DUF1863)